MIVPTHLHTLADQSSVVRWMLMLFMLDFYFESLAPTLVPHFSHQLIRAGTQQRVLCRISITYQPFVGQALLRMFRPPAGQKTESPASSEREATHAGYTGRKTQTHYEDSSHCKNEHFKKSDKDYDCQAGFS